MKFEKTEVWGFEHAIRGMRNSLESWDKSDSEYKTNRMVKAILRLGKNSALCRRID